MAILAHILGSGASPLHGAAIVGGVITTEVGAGTTHADATLLTIATNHVISTAANNSGVILPPGNGSGDSLNPGDSMVIYNGDSNTLLLYPPLGGTLNSGVATTGTVSIATKTSVRATAITNLKFIVEGPNT